jgi:hypothetical protein
MATRKAPVKKAASKKEVWCYMDKNYGECFSTYASYDAMIKAIKKEVEEAAYNDGRRNPVFQIFKLEKEIKFEVDIREVPVMTKKVTAKVKE